MSRVDGLKASAICSQMSVVGGRVSKLFRGTSTLVRIASSTGVIEEVDMSLTYVGLKIPRSMNGVKASRLFDVEL